MPHTISNINELEYQELESRGVSFQTLDLSGDNLGELKTGDHVCFPAGEPVPHHIENRSSENLKYLVFGERKQGDVVFYPEQQVLLVKAFGAKLFNYEPS